MVNDKKPEKPQEKEAVYTTIVGGRPPGCGTQVGNIPRGIEVLVKKASVDPDFRWLLLTKRSEAAKEIDLDLSQPEIDMLNNIPIKQLEKIIENTKVQPDHKAVFMSNLGKVMLALVVAGAAIGIIGPNIINLRQSAGISPDRIREIQAENNINPSDPNDPNDSNTPDLSATQQEQLIDQGNKWLISKGISPDRIDRCN